MRRASSDVLIPFLLHNSHIISDVFIFCSILKSYIAINNINRLVSKHKYLNTKDSMHQKTPPKRGILM